MRKKINAFGLAALLLPLCFFSTLFFAFSFPADAQQPTKVPRVGILLPGKPPTRPALEGFRQGLRDLGYIEGQGEIKRCQEPFSSAAQVLDFGLRRETRGPDIPLRFPVSRTDNRKPKI